MATAATGAVLLLPVTGQAPAFAASASASKAPSTAGEPASDTQSPPGGRYIVTLRDPAAATYAGGVAGKARTAPRAGEGLKTDSAAVRGYRSFLHQRQEQTAAAVGARVISSYSAAINGFTAELKPAQIERLRTDPSVVSVVKDELRKPLGAVASTDYLGLSGEAGVWAANGGVGKAGEGTVVGVIDTGIAPENPSFAGASLGTDPGPEPYRDGSTITYRKSDGGTFTGTCTVGVQFTAADCNTKIVSARYFVDNFGPGSIGGPEVGEYLSPRDGESHGSHTASTAAGDNGVGADLDGAPMGKISGVAPAAKVAVYKACWSGPSEKDIEDDGCATGDLLAAIDAAVADNVDVINYSIGTPAGAQSTDSVTDEAFRNAAASGIFVATAGGNSGPDASTVDNASPWITTAAASTIPTSEATVELGNGVNLLGASVSLPAGDSPLTGPLVAASAAGTDTAGRPNLCGPDSLDPAKVTGRIVVCERGTYDRLVKSAEVKRAGGIGAVLVNPTPDSLDLDLHTIPTVQINADGYDAIVSYAATDAAKATLVPGNPDQLASAPTPQIAGFSSRGPLTADGGDLIKPDIAAPGVGILADGSNPAGGSPRFTFMSGTSMASPHVAGLAALYLGVHPQATPAEIKSAMMTTTSPTVDPAGDPSGDVFAQGNGQADPTRYLHPGLLYLNGPADWADYVAAVGGDSAAPAPSDLNLASVGVGSLAGKQTVTRTVTSTEAGTFTADQVRIPGVETTVEPSELTFTGPGESKSFRVTFTRTTAPIGEYATGYLTWHSGKQSVRSALAVRPVDMLAPGEATGAGSSGKATVTVKGGETRDLPVKTSGLSRGIRFQGTGTVGGPAQTDILEVPAGTEHLRLALDAADDTADLNLSLYRLDAYGSMSLVQRAGTESADELLDLDDPQPGLYQVEIDFFRGDGPLAFTETGFVLNDSGAEGAFTAQPGTAHLQAGATTPVGLSWKGLRDGGVYLGRLDYGDTGRSTYVTVTSDTSSRPPQGDPHVRPQVTVQQDYTLAGQSVVVLAKGLTPAVDFRIGIKGSAKVLVSGHTRDDGTVARSVTLPSGLGAGQQTIELTYATGKVRDTFTVSELVLGELSPVDRHAFDGNPLAGVVGPVRGKGTVHVTIRGAAGVYLDRTVATDTPGGLFWYDWASDQVETKPGKLTATLAVVLDHGRTGQSKTVSWTPVSVTPDTASLTKDRKAAHTVKMTYTSSNEEGPVVFPTLRYKLTSGDLIFATLQANPGETFERSYDVTGVARLDLVLNGTAIATYRNEDHSRLSGRPTMVEPFYATFTRGASKPRSGPLTMTVTNRTAAYSPGTWLTVGEGTETLTGTSIFLDEQIPTPLTPQEGAPISRKIAVPAGRPLWGTAEYEMFTPILHAFARRSLLVAPVSRDDLDPVGTHDSDHEFAVDASPRAAAEGTVLSVTAAGLSSHEAYTVRLGGKVVGTGRATAGGYVQEFVRVPHSHGGTQTVLVTGDRPDRSGETGLEPLS